MKKKLISLIMVLSLMVTYSPMRVGAINTYRSANSAGWEKTTPKQNLFRLANSAMDFVLLDTFDDGYLVMTNSTVGRKIYDPDDTGKFDVEDENNIAYWLNNTYLTEAEDGITPLPDIVIKHLTEHEWFTEGGHPDTGFGEDYIVKAKVALMSQTEWVKYFWNGRMFGSDGCGYWYLRTITTEAKLDPPYASGIIVGSEMGTTNFGKATGGAQIRPIFVLDKDFFAQEKIDIKKSGGNVLQTIKENVSETELIKLYNNKNILNDMDKSIRPIASNVWYWGITIAGRELYGKYTYLSPNDKPEKNSIFRWLRSNEKDGVYRVIPGANSSTYIPTEADANKYIKFEVIPRSADNIGYPIRSNAWKIYPETAPETYDVNIVGEPANDNKLYVDYHWKDESKEPVSNTYFNWQVSEDGENFKDIDNANEQAFTPDESLCGKYIRASVQNEKLGGKTPVKGNVAFSEAVLVRGKPKVQGVNISGTDSLTGSYQYSDPLGKNEDNSALVWETSKTADGEYKSVASGNKLNISDIAQDCYIRFSVTPKNSDGVSGEKISSEPLKISVSAAGRELKSEIKAENTAKLRCSKSGFIGVVVLNIAADAEISFESNLFNIISSKTKSGYCVTLIPKNGLDACYVKDEIFTVTALQATVIKLIDAKIQNGVSNLVGF